MNQLKDAQTRSNSDKHAVSFDGGCPTRPLSWFREFQCFAQNKPGLYYMASNPDSFSVFSGTNFANRKNIIKKLTNANDNFWKIVDGLNVFLQKNIMSTTKKTEDSKNLVREQWRILTQS